jgi:hypothetical protein
MASALFIAALFIPLTAFAVPFTFTNGQVADANQVNADFAALTPIQGSSSFSPSFAPPGMGGFFFPTSPAFTAPRSLTCIVTAEATGVTGGPGANGAIVGFNTAIQIGSTQTAGSAINLYFGLGPTNGIDINFSATYTQVFSVSSGATVSFGVIFPQVIISQIFQTNVTTIYNCI